VKLGEDQFATTLELFRRKLLVARERRPRPLTDTKVLTAWNGLMIAGFATAGQALKESEYVDIAARAAEFVLRHLRAPDGRLMRTYAAAPGAKGEARLNGYLDDYACLVHGLLCLHDATGDAKWLNEARSLTDAMVERFSDPDHGGFYFTSKDHEKLFARSKDQYDGAQPSGNSVAAANLVQLWVKTGDERYHSLAEKTLRAFGGSLKANPTSLTALGSALMLYLGARDIPQDAATRKVKPDSHAKPAAAEAGVQILANSEGPAKRSDNVVQVRATSSKRDATGKQVIRIVVTIDKGWHLYANAVPKDFPGIPTTVAAAFKTKPEEFQVEYPAGKPVQDPVAGDHSVYQDSVTIKATVRRAKEDKSPLDLSLRVQACSETKCLLPATIKLVVPEAPDDEGRR
jgi:hypothetical protein